MTKIAKISKFIFINNTLIGMYDFNNKPIAIHAETSDGFVWGCMGGCVEILQTLYEKQKPIKQSRLNFF